MSNTLPKLQSATVTLKLDSSYRDRLKTLALSKKRTPHYLMKEAIERYLAIEEAQQVIMQDMDTTISHFETTGLHISHADIKDWAKDLKNNRNAQLPECHL